MHSKKHSVLLALFVLALVAFGPVKALADNWREERSTCVQNCGNVAKSFAEQRIVEKTSNGQETRSVQRPATTQSDVNDKMLKCVHGCKNAFPKSQK